MAKEETTPSEKEWMVMEILWEGQTPFTSSEIIQRLQGTAPMTSKMVRVLLNRLCQKGIIAYTQDKKDARIYHYFPLKSREECLKEKSRRFVDSYFAGNQTGAFAALLQSFSLTKEQFQELEEMLDREKDRQEGNDGP